MVVIDGLFNDCALGFAHKWDAKIVWYATSTIYDWWPDKFGFATETSYVPSIYLGINLPLDFMGRVYSTLMLLFGAFRQSWVVDPAIEKILKEKLQLPAMPSIQELNQRSSLLLMNSHYSEDLPRSLPPMVVPIGGMHCSDKLDPLPKNIEEFINGSGNNGFMFVSFGSLARIDTAPEYLRQMFFSAFRNSKIRFIWKWEGERPKDMPPNVMTVKWAPQQPILAHPKIKGFINHGGLLGIQEAIWHEVPMIILPIFAEQDYNAEKIHRTKRGIRLEISELSQTELENAIEALIYDDMYKKSIRKDSEIFKDRPEDPVKTGTWWMEYVLRHNDTSFLRPHGMSQTWYQRRLLDVWAFLASVLLALVSSFIVLFKKIFSFCCLKNNYKNTNAKKVKVKKT